MSSILLQIGKIGWYQRMLCLHQENNGFIARKT